MKKILSLVLVIISFNVNASIEDRVSFGLMQLGDQLNKFEKLNSECFASSRNKLLSNETIKVLNKLPRSTSESLGYLSMRAIRVCSEPEYSETLRLLLSLEGANNKLNDASVTKKIENIKSLLFPGVGLISEKKFYELPEKIKNELLSIKELNKPFNMIDGFERAWSNK